MFAVKVTVEVFDTDDGQTLAFAERTVGVIPPNGITTSAEDMLLMVAATADAEGAATVGDVQRQLRDGLEVVTE